MNEWLDSLRRIAEDPTQNAAAVGAGLAIVVVFIIIVVLLLVAAALPNAPSSQPVGTPSPGSRRKRMPAWLIAVLGIAIATGGVLTATVLWYRSTSSNQYCTKTCHSMATATETWAVSSHRSVDCVRCHEGRPWVSFPRGVTNRVYYLYLEYSGASPRADRVSPRICLSCHIAMMPRPITARNGEPFKHTDLQQALPDCTACHGDQGHERPRP